MNDELKQMIDIEVKAAVDRHTTGLTTAVFEIKGYRIFFRMLAGVVVTAVLGGTIWGVYRLDSYLENRVLTAVKDLEEVNLAAYYASAEQFQDALSVLDGLWHKIETKRYKLSAETKTFLLLETVWVLSQVGSEIPGHRWAGKALWDRVVQDVDFRSKFFTSDQWPTDSYVKRNLAYCYLKYEDADNAIDIAKGYLGVALKYSDNSEDVGSVAGLHVDLALIEYLQGNKRECVEELKRAEASDPRGHAIADLMRSWTAFYRGNEWKVFETRYLRDNNGTVGPLRDGFREYISKALASDNSQGPTVEGAG